MAAKTLLFVAILLGALFRCGSSQYLDTAYPVKLDPPKDGLLDVDYLVRQIVKQDYPKSNWRPFPFNVYKRSSEAAVLPPPPPEVTRDESRQYRVPIENLLDDFNQLYLDVAPIASIEQTSSQQLESEIVAEMGEQSQQQMMGGMEEPEQETAKLEKKYTVDYEEAELEAQKGSPGDDDNHLVQQPRGLEN